MSNFAQGQIVHHLDPIMGAEKVKILMGPLEVTTTTDTYYVVEFIEDQQTWLVHPDDLDEIK